MYIWYVRIPYMHSALFVRDAIFPHVSYMSKDIAKLAAFERRRVRDRAHRASRSAAQRERVLDYRRGLLASETPDQRTSRLQQMSFGD